MRARTSFSLQSRHQEYYFHITIGRLRNVQGTVSNAAVGYVSTVSCYFEKSYWTPENPQYNSCRLRIHMQSSYQKGTKTRSRLFYFRKQAYVSSFKTQDLNSIKYGAFQQTEAK